MWSTAGQPVVETSEAEQRSTAWRKRCGAPQRAVARLKVSNQVFASLAAVSATAASEETPDPDSTRASWCPHPHPGASGRAPGSG